MEGVPSFHLFFQSHLGCGVHFQMDLQPCIMLSSLVSLSLAPCSSWAMGAPSTVPQRGQLGRLLAPCEARGWRWERRATRRHRARIGESTHRPGARGGRGQGWRDKLPVRCTDRSEHRIFTLLPSSNVFSTIFYLFSLFFWIFFNLISNSITRCFPKFMYLIF